MPRPLRTSLHRRPALPLSTFLAPIVAALSSRSSHHTHHALSLAANWLSHGSLSTRHDPPKGPAASIEYSVPLQITGTGIRNCRSFSSSCLVPRFARLVRLASDLPNCDGHCLLSTFSAIAVPTAELLLCLHSSLRLRLRLRLGLRRHLALLLASLGFPHNLRIFARPSSSSFS